MRDNETRESSAQAEVTKTDVDRSFQQIAVTARMEWFRQMRLQSAVFAMQLNVRNGLGSSGDAVVADAEKIFEFLTKEDVN